MRLRKDIIFVSLLDEAIMKGYLQKDDIEDGLTITDALTSKDPLLKVLASIIDSQEKSKPDTPRKLKEKINNFLNIQWQWN